MMGANALLTALAVVTLVLAVVLNQTNTQNFKLKEAKAPEDSQVLSEVDEDDEESLEATSTPLSTPESTVSPSPISKPTASPTSKSVSSIELNLFWYPGANVILRENNSFTLSSFDNVDKIVEWYQEKLKELKMPAKSLAKTNTNGNVLAKLAGAKSGSEVNIEIKKSEGDALVSIKVDISSN